MGKTLYSKSDMVKVVDADGVVQPDSIPSAWLGTEFASGMKKATKKQLEGDTTADEPATPPAPPAPPAGEQEPAGNANAEAWSEYAVKVKGAKPEDLVDADGKPLGRDALRDKFGTSQS